MFCHKCGKKLEPRSKFCSNCGTKVIEEPFTEEKVPTSDRKMSVNDDNNDTSSDEMQNDDYNTAGEGVGTVENNSQDALIHPKRSDNEFIQPKKKGGNKKTVGGVAIVVIIIVAVFIVKALLAGHSEESFDTGDSVIMDGSNNDSGIVQPDEELFYTDKAAKDREDTSENHIDFDTGDSKIMDGANNPEDTVQSGNSRNTDGTYNWQIGNSTLTTKINVMDYIDGNVWHVNDMARDLGWDKNKRADSPCPMTFQPDETYYVYISFTERDGFCGGVYVMGDERGKPIDVVLKRPLQGNNLTLNDSDLEISFEGVVIFAYTCEYLTDNPVGDPYDSVLPRISDEHYNY